MIHGSLPPGSLFKLYEAFISSLMMDPWSDHSETKFSI